MTQDIPDVAKEVVRQETPRELPTTLSIAIKICEVADPNSTSNGELFIEDGGLGEKTPDVLKTAYRRAAEKLVLDRRAARNNTPVEQY